MGPKGLHHFKLQRKVARGCTSIVEVSPALVLYFQSQISLNEEIQLNFVFRFPTRASLSSVLGPFHAGPLGRHHNTPDQTSYNYYSGGRSLAWREEGREPFQ